MNVSHPSTFFDTNELNAIRNSGGAAEQHQTLHTDQLHVLYEQNLFRMFVPKTLGGLEYDLPRVLRTEEALAWADGSTAWVATLCSGAGWFAGFLDPDLSKKIFSDPKVCLAGSGAPTGTAEMRNGSYNVSGTWRYASGALHATMFTANCVITKNGITVLTEDGTPRIQAFIFSKDEVQLVRNWNSMGMIATASHGFSVANLSVPQNRSFIIDQNHARLNSPVFQYPFLQLAETTLAVNLSGMAQQFIDLCLPLFADRMTKGYMKKDLISFHQTQQDNLQRSRNSFFDAADTSWRDCLAGQRLTESILSRVSTASVDLYRESLSAVTALYPYAGLAAANTATEINRVWRNLHTASQHTLFSSR